MCLQACAASAAFHFSRRAGDRFTAVAAFRFQPSTLLPPMISTLTSRFHACRALVAAAALATCAHADTVFFDNTDAPIASGSFISAFVSQNVRIKTDSFSPGDSLAYIDIWLTQFNAADGKLPSLNLYQDNSGALGSLLASAQLAAAPATSQIPQHVQVDFINGPTLADETFYWIGMSFAAGSTGSFAWSTSLDAQMTSLAFITAFGVNYVGTFNVPHVKLVGTSTTTPTVPDTGSAGMYLGLLLSGMAGYRSLRWQRKQA
jgi:hypothetical protein